jgi:hypothetical protein
MFNYETEHIIRKVQDIVLGGRDKVSLRMILSSPIHNAIKIYFRAYVYVQYDEKSQLPSAKSADEIDSLRRDLDMLLPTHYSFDKDTFTSVLTEAVFFTFNFLCRPRWTMQEFFYQKSDPVPVEELKQGFIYFSAYEYYPEILLRYTEKHRMSSVTREQFADITGKIDRLVFSDAGPEDFIKILQPLASFIEYGRIDGNGSIPEHALGLFFGDKGFEAIKLYLKGNLSKKNIDSISLMDLRELLVNAPPPLSEYRPDVSPETEPPAAAGDMADISESPIEDKHEGIDEEPIEAPEHADEKVVEEPEELPADASIHIVDEEISAEEPLLDEVEQDEEISVSDVTEESPISDLEPETTHGPVEEEIELSEEEIDILNEEIEAARDQTEQTYIDDETGSVEEVTETVGEIPESEEKQVIDEETETTEEAVTDREEEQASEEQIETDEDKSEILTETPETSEQEIEIGEEDADTIDEEFSTEEEIEVVEEEAELSEEDTELIEDEAEIIDETPENVIEETEQAAEESLEKAVTEEMMTEEIDEMDAEEEDIEEEILQTEEAETYPKEEQDTGYTDEEEVPPDSIDEPVKNGEAETDETIQKRENGAEEPKKDDTVSAHLTEPDDIFVPKKTKVSPPKVMEPETEPETRKPRDKKPDKKKTEDIPVPTMPAYTSLELLIDDDERKRFIRKLFNGDEAYYSVIIQTLDKMTSWKEASLYIDEIFLMNGVDPYSSDSVHFTDKVYSRFSRLRTKK